jgi:hypothetical protein
VSQLEGMEANFEDLVFHETTDPLGVAADFNYNLQTLYP